MLEELRALIALESAGTISEAATRLRLTQSAVSKRIQSLEAQLNYKVVEPQGRKLKISERGLILLKRAKPLLFEIESLKDLSDASSVRRFSVGLADSIASSWGPRLIKESTKKLNSIQLELHVHRSTMVLEQLKSGRYEMGLLTGAPQGAGLVWELLASESMVLVGKPDGGLRSSPILTIETNSATWNELGPSVLAHERFREKEFIHLESFSAAIQMAKEGFGEALVPLGLAKTMGLKEQEIQRLSPKLKRQIHFVARKSIFTAKSVRKFKEGLKRQIQTIV